MKRKLAILAGTCAALFALGGVAAGSALAAAPEFEAPGGFSVPFTSTSGPGVLETEEGNVVECQSDENTGEVANTKEVRNVRVTFRECTTIAPLLGEIDCTSAGQNVGVIVTNLLSGELVTILNGAGKATGIDLVPQEAPLFAEFDCGPVTITVQGSLLGRVEPIGVLTDQFTLVFHQANGIQEYVEFENEAHEVKVDFLESEGTGGPFGIGNFPLQQSGLEGIDRITSSNGEKVKIVG